MGEFYITHQRVIVPPPGQFIPKRFQIHAGRDINGGQGLESGRHGPEVDHAIHGRRSVQRRGGAFDDLHLANIFNGQCAPFDVIHISRQQRQPVQQHHHPAAGAIAVTASTADVRLAIQHIHPRHQAYGFIQLSCDHIFNETGRDHFHRYGHIRQALLV